MPTITTLIPFHRALQRGNTARGLLHASRPAQKAQMPGLRGSHPRLGATSRAGAHPRGLAEPPVPH